MKEGMLPLSRLDRAARGAAEEPAERLEDHVVIVGYGHAGRHLKKVLSDTSIPFVVVEMNPNAIREMDREDVRSVFGDASRAPVLHAAGIEVAKLCVVVTNEPSVTPRIVYQARYMNPTLQIIVRTRYLGTAEELQKSGADIVVPEEMETTVRIFSHVLGAYMVPPDEVDRHVKMLRAENYGIMRGSIQEAHLMVLQGLDEEGLHTRAVAVRDGAPAANRTLEDLALRRQHALTVLAVRRDGRTISSPAGDFRVLPGDRLVLIGEAARFAECAEIFRTPPEGREGKIMGT